MRHALSHRQVAVPFFTCHLPEAVTQVIDLEQIRAVRESFIDREQTELISGAVFSVPRTDTGSDAFIYISSSTSSATAKICRCR